MKDTQSGLSPDERGALERDGFLIREKAFDAAEVRRIAADCEGLVEQVLDVAKGRKVRVGSYMFEQQNDLSMYVKWEPESPELLQALEPFAHMSEPLAALANDPRLVGPSRAICGQDEIALYTEKLNLKRAHQGGQYILHQDFPYWQDENPVAANVATAMLFLDDATIENGCMQVAPGTHREGVQAMRKVKGFGALEMDTDAFDMNRLVAVEAKAGSVLFFGSFLVHRSLPNRSAADRRAILYSYQPAGHPHVVDLMRQEQARAGNSVADWA
jgi:ectoine hydroxylase